MINRERVYAAVRIAYAALNDNFTEDGIPVLYNCFQIAEQMPDETTTCVALLLPAVEAGVFDLEYIRQQGFSEDVIYALEILHSHDNSRINSCPIAWVVKHAELLQAYRHEQSKTPSNIDVLFKNIDVRAELESPFNTPYISYPAEIRVQEQVLQNRRFRDYIRGCFVGGAVGDAFGYSGSTNRFSFNTQMNLVTAGGILHAWTWGSVVGFDHTETDAVSWAFQYLCPLPGEKKRNKVAWIFNIPEIWDSRGPDEACLAILREGRYGYPDRPISDCKSWTCLMRIAPLLYHKNDDMRHDLIKSHLRTSEETTVLTHGHPLAILSAAMFTHILSRYIYGGSTRGNALPKIVEEGKHYLFECFGNSEHLHTLFAKLNTAISLAGNNDKDVLNIGLLGTGESADEALAIAVYCSLRYPLDFEKAITAASNHAGNAAATGCLTGNILGAKMGYDEIAPFAKKLERLDLLLEIADDLCAKNQLHRSNVEYDDPTWRHKYLICDYAM